ncbi:hypothetical protein KIH74_13580 [Kineosporia sp. J2-2]|uniref:Bacterial CdiA-CT RNAse A domain-containing protein n=1 Tax=Kineosporia corallincola TaxID=2835133 RepID=A0ABS5TIR4_9ACTN|nr:hypothetical protein [Kineosporia corallincola]MBT0769963.1 hypothetical protein [Kineosporia corallincola]
MADALPTATVTNAPPETTAAGTTPEITPPPEATSPASTATSINSDATPSLDTEQSNLAWVSVESDDDVLQVGDTIPKSAKVLTTTGETTGAALSAPPTGGANVSSKAAAQTWAACPSTGSNSKVVRVFNRLAATTSTGHNASRGSATVRCGFAHATKAHVGSGYRHIKKEHMSDWEALGSVAGENWRDVADLAMSSAFGDPEKVTHRGKNDTFCYQHKLVLANRNTGKVVATTFTRNIVGNGNWDVITTFPNAKCPADA